MKRLLSLGFAVGLTALVSCGGSDSSFTIPQYNLDKIVNMVERVGEHTYSNQKTGMDVYRLIFGKPSCSPMGELELEVTKKDDNLVRLNMEIISCGETSGPETDVPCEGKETRIVPRRPEDFKKFVDFALNPTPRYGPASNEGLYGRCLVGAKDACTYLDAHCALGDARACTLVDSVAEHLLKQMGVNNQILMDLYLEED